MRRLIISLVLSVFLIGVSVYLLTILSPFDTEATKLIISAEKIRTFTEFRLLVEELIGKGLIWDYLNINNVLIISLTSTSGFVAGFTFFHLLIDKLFFRKFYEEPSLIAAVRRGVFASLGILGVIFGRLYALPWYVWLMWVILLLIIELLIWKFFQKPVDPEHKGDKTTFGNLLVILKQRAREIRSGEFDWRKLFKRELDS